MEKEKQEIDETYKYQAVSISPYLDDGARKYMHKYNNCELLKSWAGRGGRIREIKFMEAFIKYFKPCPYCKRMVNDK
jgi:hypothetical protein